MILNLISYDICPTPDWQSNRKAFLCSIKAFHTGKISKEKPTEYFGEKYSAIPSFLKKYGYEENEDYFIVRSKTRTKGIMIVTY
jgi:hypothetical protein